MLDILPLVMYNIPKGVYMDYGKFLQKLRKIRKQKGISLREMGRKMGVSAQQVSFFERGHTPIKVKDYFFICDVLEISPKSLMEGEISYEDCNDLIERIHVLSKKDFLIIKNMVELLENHCEEKM